MTKVLLSIPSILKKTLMSDRFSKSFSFSIDSPLFKKASEVLIFCISADSNSMYWHVPSETKLKTNTAWKVSQYRVFSGPHFPAFGLNTEVYGVNHRIQSKCGKIKTRKTPYLDTFHAVQKDLCTKLWIWSTFFVQIHLLLSYHVYKYSLKVAQRK